MSQITKYKVLLDILHKSLKEYTKEALDDYLKYSVGLSGSCKDFSQDQMNDLIESCYYLAVQIGLEIDENERIWKAQD